METSTAHFYKDISNIIEQNGKLDLAVAFVTEAGLSLVRDIFEEKLESGESVRLLVDLKEGATDPTALWNLVALSQTYPGRLLLKAYVSSQGILHSKVYINEKGENATLISGSANLSNAALTENVEHGLRVVGSSSEKVIREAKQEFESLWNSEYAFNIDEEAVRRYEIYAGLQRTSLSRAERRSRGAWRDLVKHLTETPPVTFEWPSVRAAFIIGAITARGFLDLEASSISIPLLFRTSGYKDGRIAVRGVSFDPVEVLPSIPQFVASEAKLAIPQADVTIDKMKVEIDLSKDSATFGLVAGLFAPQVDCDCFRLPRQLAVAGDSVVSEFVRGFAVASALLTDATSMPGNSLTGLPGQMTVWLRPKQGNQVIFNQLYEILTRRMQIAVYQHRRSYREPHLKVPCESFAEIGFGINWWDELLRAGADYNHALFPNVQEGLPGL